MVVTDVDSVMTCGAALAKIFCQYSTMQHWAFQSITLFPFPNQKRPFFSVCLRMIVMTEMLLHAWDTRGAYKGLPSSQTSALP